MEKRSECSLVKKVKLDSAEVAVTTANIASVKNAAASGSTTAPKPPAATTTAAGPAKKAKPAQQATLTSFFKKA